jgi:hypothetical protein
MPKSVSTYVYFIGISGLIFVLHILGRQVMSTDLWTWIMVQSYALNVLLGLGLIAVAQGLLARQSSYVGWVFIGLSGVKFVLFFVFIWPQIRQDGITSQGEFASFFIPYLSCLFMELRFLSKRLNAL